LSKKEKARKSERKQIMAVLAVSRGVEITEVGKVLEIREEIIFKYIKNYNRKYQERKITRKTRKTK
jgi:hypothetical protein